MGTAVLQVVSGKAGKQATSVRSPRSALLGCLGAIAEEPEGDYEMERCGRVETEKRRGSRGEEDEVLVERKGRKRFSCALDEFFLASAESKLTRGGPPFFFLGGRSKGAGAG